MSATTVTVFVYAADLFESRRSSPELVELQVRQVALPFLPVASGHIQHALRRLDRQPPQADRVDDREEGGVDGDAESERETPSRRIPVPDAVASWRDDRRVPDRRARRRSARRDARPSPARHCPGRAVPLDAPRRGSTPTAMFVLE